MDSVPKTLLEHALHYARQGWCVFPLAPGAKVPLQGSHGLNEATTDETQIRRWWSLNPDANIGINCGMSGLVVVDIDVKNGKDGNASLTAILAGEHALSPTATVTTPSGGRHMYYTGSCPSSVNKLGPGLDIRGLGGYVVAPPSTLTGKSVPYVWKFNFQPIPFPEKLRSMIENMNNTIVHDANIYQGERNSSLTSMAGKLRNLGLNENEILSVLKEKNDEQCVPPLPSVEIEKIAKSIASYSVGGLGSENKSRSNKAQSFDELAEIVNEEVEWIVEGMLRRGGILLLSARPKVGKSDLARNLARSIALGDSFLSRHCQQGSVLWIGLEELRSHLYDRAEIMGLNNLPITYLFDGPSVNPAQWLESVILENDKPAVVIIDTLARWIKVDDLNDYSKVNNATQPVIDLGRKYGTTFVLLHHNNKSEKTLGSSGLEAFCDTIMTLEP
jgi:hypothetical protein